MAWEVMLPEDNGETRWAHGGGETWWEMARLVRQQHG